MANFIPSNAQNSSGTSIRVSTQGNPATLQSQGLYYNPNVPRQSSAGAGFQGADDRAYTRNVQGNELVSNQLTGLLNSNNPYMQNAAQRGRETAASRGLLNSSIAAGNAQRAAIEAGMPIAQADAATYGRAATENLGYLNQNLMQERDIANRMLQQNRDIELSQDQLRSQEGINASQLAGMLQRQRENLAFEGEQAGLGRAHDFGMTGFRADLDQFAADRALERSDFAAMRDLERQNWLADQNFSRDLYGTLAGTQINSMSGFTQALSQALLNDPQVFGDPEYLSGINNFFQNNIIGNVMNQLWASFYGQGG